MSCPQHARSRQQASRQDGFTLVEALVAMMIVAMVVISYLGIRTSALIDATRARDWRLAREIAEEKMSELQAGARETQPENGAEVPIEKYEGFSYKIVIGESAVADLEAEVDSIAADAGTEESERLSWQRDRDNYRKAAGRGLTQQEYEDQLLENDYARKMAEKAPSETDLEEVAVAVYFPKLEADHPDQKEVLVIKARISTLALSGMTPDQAAVVAQARGESSSGGEANGSAASGGGAGGSNTGGR
ncbi:MAG: prepilin-type N-terminal cleavage/methylation domain-containing protein [Planctomycetes bacterium]|nr:prepilin-type N-terminal cleavage/methylation domain-containing protein [Planctomycetota bacterium]